MKPLHETSLRELAISAAKTKNRQNISLSSQERKAEDILNSLESRSSLLPPENLLLRTVPASVKRCANATTRALPPPSTTTKSASRGEAKPKKGKSRKVGQLGDNSDGDSDDDHPRKRGHTADDGDALVSRRKTTGKAPDPKWSGHSSSASFHLTPEEQQRVRLRAQLQAAEEKWKKLEIDRQGCISRKSNRELLLAEQKSRRWKGTWKTEISQISEFVEKGRRLKNFHDEILLDHIEQQLHQDMKEKECMPSRSTIYIDDVFDNVEEKIIVRCQAYDPHNPWNWDVMPQSKRDRMIRIFDKIQTSLMEELMASCDPRNDVRATVAAFMSKQCFGPSSAFTEQKEDILVDQYLNALSERLVTVVKREIDSILPKTGIDKPEASHPATASNFDAIALRCAAWGVFIDQAKTTLDIETLREEGQRWYLHERQKVLQNFRHDLQNVRVRQEFVENLDQLGGVSLLLFKGDMLASIQSISPEKLEWLGWKRDGRSRNYWRYSAANFERSFSNSLQYRGPSWGGSKGTLGSLFKVQMDGEVVGIWTADGDIDWSS